MGDVFAVNKSDRPGAESMLAEIKLNLQLNSVSADAVAHHGLAGSASTSSAAPASMNDAAQWEPPVIRLVATAGEGVAELLDVAERHRLWLASLPAQHPLRLRRVVRELAFVVQADVARVLAGATASLALDLAGKVAIGELPLAAAAQQYRQALIAALSES